MSIVRRLTVLAAGAVSAAALGVTGLAGTASAAPPSAPAAPAAPSATPCAPTAKACVDLSAHRAWLTDGAGHVTYGPVAARGGKRGSETPVGTFSVLWKDADHRSHQFDNAPMPWSVFFYSGDAFHGGNTAQTSNGCVHLSTASAKRFYDALRVGDRVQIVS